MRKVIAGINMTVDGVFDHTAIEPDEEIHNHYSELLLNAGTLLYGRITYLLMEDYWPTIIKSPTDNKSLNDFAVAIDSIPKIVFSNTLKKVEWDSAQLAKRSLEEEVLALKQQPGKDILANSRSLIIALLNLHLVDEFQLTVHPVIAGTGLPLFENINDRIQFKLLKTKTFKGGAVTFYYKPTNK